MGRAEENHQLPVGVAPRFEDAMTCPTCRVTHMAPMKYCPRDGSPLVAIHCDECHTLLWYGASYCPMCGAMVGDQVATVIGNALLAMQAAIDKEVNGGELVM
jgi:hypothetical protein